MKFSIYLFFPIFLFSNDFIETNFFENNCLILIFALVCLLLNLYFYIKRKKEKPNIRNENLISKNYNDTKIEITDFSRRDRDIDILKSMYPYLKMINLKSSLNKNKVLLDFNPKFHRFFRMDFKRFSVILYGIINFYLQNLREKSIIIKIEELPILNENKSKIKVSVKANSKLDNEDEIQKIIKNKSSGFLNHKSLTKALEFALLQNININFSNFEDGSAFSFEIILKKYFMQNPLIECSYNNMKAIIKSNNKDEFEILKNQLDFLGIHTPQSSDMNLADKLIKDAIFFPQIVFISAQILLYSTNKELKNLASLQKNKNFHIVIISPFDLEIQSVLDILPNVNILKQPYIIDEIKSILKTIKFKN